MVKYLRKTHHPLNTEIDSIDNVINGVSKRKLQQIPQKENTFIHTSIYTDKKGIVTIRRTKNLS